MNLQTIAKAARVVISIAVPIGVNSVVTAGMNTIKPHAPRIDTRWGKVSFWLGNAAVSTYVSDKIHSHLTESIDEFFKDVEEATDIEETEEVVETPEGSEDLIANTLIAGNLKDATISDEEADRPWEL